jgi:GNAT superfamily N-acetyltransferase
VSRSSWLIETLRDDHDRAAFDCGAELLDRYLRHQAGQDLRRACAIPFVLVPEAGSNLILGYYTLSSFGVDWGELPASLARKLPRYPLLPATLIGRLAVDRRHQGQGIGEILLMDALHRSWIQSTKVAATAIVVDALDENAVRFYRRFDFIALPATPRRLFLPMKTVAALFRS